MPPKKRGIESASVDIENFKSEPNKRSRFNQPTLLNSKHINNKQYNSNLSKNSDVLVRKPTEDVINAIMRKITNTIKDISGSRFKENWNLKLLMCSYEIDSINESQLKKYVPSLSVSFSRPVFGVLEREVIFTSVSIEDLIKGVFFTVYTIQYNLDLRYFNEDSVYFFNSFVNKEVLDNLSDDQLTELGRLKSIMISSTIIPGTINVLSCKYRGTIEDIIASMLFLLTTDSENISLKRCSVFSPFTASSFKRTSKNQTLLIQSSQTYNKYINNELIITTNFHQKNPKTLAIIQLEQAKLQTARCDPTKTTKQIIKFPLDCLPKLTVNNGARLSDIRGKSNANIIVGEEVVDMDYKEVTVQGIPEGVLFVLDIFFHIINKVLHPELTRKRRFKRG